MWVRVWGAGFEVEVRDKCRESTVRREHCGTFAPATMFGCSIDARQTASSARS